MQQYGFGLRAGSRTMSVKRSGTAICRARKGPSASTLPMYGQRAKPWVEVDQFELEKQMCFEDKWTKGLKTSSFLTFFRPPVKGPRSERHETQRLSVVQLYR